MSWGKNCCVNLSTNLVVKKNILPRVLETVGNPLKEVELLRLFKSVRLHSRSLRKSEHKQKAKWNRKQANSLFNKSPCLVGKRVLEVKCYVRLSAHKKSMD